MKRFAGFAAACALAALCTTSAFADTPLSVDLGPYFVTGSNSNGVSTTMFDFGANYDFGPRILVPVRASLQFDYANGNGSRSQNYYGVGVAGRLTTPLYAGLGISFYGINGAGQCTSAPGGKQCVSITGSGIGTNYFIGSKLLGFPDGGSLSLEGTYKALPNGLGLNLSGIGVGLRVQF